MKPGLASAIAVWLLLNVPHANAAESYKVVIDVKDGPHVVWGTNETSCGIQIRLASCKSREQPDGSEVYERLPEFPSTQVWLLRRDGTVISQTREPIIFGWGSWGTLSYDKIYVFSPSAGTEAYAVVVRFGEKLYTERIAQKP